MSHGRTPRGGDVIDRALGEWPDTPRTALEWDDAADQISARIAAGAKPRSSMEVSDDDLFRAPLPQTRTEEESVRDFAAGGEVPESEQGKRQSRERDRQSLKDLAKLAAATSSVSPSAPLPREDSGVITIPVLSSLPMTPPIPSMASMAKSATGSAVPAAPRSRPVLPPELMPVPASPASEGPRQTTRQVEPAVQVAQAQPMLAPPASKGPTGKKRGGATWTLFGVLAVAAAVGGVWLGVRNTAKAPLATATPVSNPTPSSPPVTSAVQASAPAMTTAAASAGPASVPVTALAVADGKTGGTKQAPMSGGPAAPGRPSLPVAVNPPPPPAPDPKPAAPAKAAPAGTDLNSLMAQAVGVTPTATPRLTPANNDTSQPQGNVPLKPSLGAIQGALGAAVPRARACLGPDDAVSHATVTFQSDGSVQKVGVSGGASGTAAEGCIRSALMKAHVPPFAQPTFSSPVTIRPN